MSTIYPWHDDFKPAPPQSREVKTVPGAGLRGRWSTWVARLTLLSPLVIPWLLWTQTMVSIFYWPVWILFARPIKTPHEFWPWGHVHHVWLVALAGIGYPVIGIVLLMVAVLACCLLALILRSVWCTAWRIDHTTVWTTGNAIDQQKIIRYEKAEPLVRGRVGSR